jgi:hypothetical protein
MNEKHERKPLLLSLSGEQQAVAFGSRNASFYNNPLLPLSATPLLYPPWMNTYFSPLVYEKPQQFDALCYHANMLKQEQSAHLSSELAANARPRSAPPLLDEVSPENDTVVFNKCKITRIGLKDIQVCAIHVHN